MADAHPPAAAPDAEQRRRLLTRVGFAAVLIGLLVGALALYDALNRPAPPAAEPPPALAQKLAEPAPPPAPAAQEPPAAPAQEAPPGAPAAAADASPAAAPAPPATPEQSAAPQVRVPGAREPAAPKAPPPALAKKGEDRLQLSAPPERPAGTGGYVVQVGVFSNPENAEELRARLARAGVPTRVEVHVHTGPFASRKEAQEASRRLKALGISATLLIPLKR